MSEPDLETLRAAVETAVYLTSLRDVGAAIGIGRTAVLHFINGKTEPRARSRRLLVAWYAEHVPAGGFDPSARPVRRTKEAAPPAPVPNDPGPPLPELRNALRHAVEDSSFNAVAAAVGVSPSGLWRLVQGNTGSIRSSTLAKLRKWYLSRDTREAEPRDSLAETALAVLLDGLPSAQVPGARQAVVAALAAAFTAEGTPVPRWLRRLT